MHAFVGDEPQIEYLAGRAVPKVSPKHRHGVVQGTLWSLVRRLGRSRGTVATEWRFRLDDGPARRTHLVPDVAFVSYERWTPLSEDERQEPRFAPDIAIEIRSPDDRESDVLWKMRAYLDAGALLALDVLVQERRIIAYARDGAHEFGEGERFTHPDAAWLSFEVAEAFANLEPGE